MEEVIRLGREGAQALVEGYRLGDKAVIERAWEWVDHARDLLAPTAGGNP